MGKDYVTHEQLEQRLKNVKVSGFSHYAGQSLKDITGGVVYLTKEILKMGVLVYAAMSLAYGPYDAGKVIYSEFSGDKFLKHKHVELAKSFYAGRLHKQELDERDLKNLFIELGVVETSGTKPTEEDITWYRLLDWIEDND